MSRTHALWGLIRMDLVAHVSCITRPPLASECLAWNVAHHAVFA